jgi:hypothetical protein
MQNGQFTGHVAPIGYIKDPENKHKLIIEERSAELVRYIFSLAAGGLGTGKIASRLNTERVPTIREHWHMVNPDVTWDWRYTPSTGTTPTWRSKAICDILTNKTYIGTFVGNKSQTKSFKNRKIVKLPESEWIEIPGIHPVLIDEETFNLAQRVLKIKQRENNQKHENIYVGFLKCSDCGTGLSLKYTTAASGSIIRGFMCNRYRSPAMTGGVKVCTAHYISEKTLEAALLASIRNQGEAAKTNEGTLAEYAAGLVKSSNDKTLRQAKSEISRLNRRNAELDTIISRMYEDYALGTITVERYQSMALKYEQEQTQVRERLNILNQQLTTQETQQDGNIRFLKAVRQYTDVETITRQMLVELVDKIVIFNGTGKGKHRDQQIDIYYRINGLVDSYK